jgi:hypothetical protein
MTGVRLNGFVLNDPTFTGSDSVMFDFKIAEDGKRIFTIDAVIQQSGAWLVASQQQVFYLVYIQTQNTLYRVKARKIEFNDAPSLYSLSCQILNPKTGFSAPCQPDMEVKHYLFKRLGDGANEQALYNEQQIIESNLYAIVEGHTEADLVASTDFQGYLQKALHESQALYIKKRKYLRQKHITFAAHIFPWFEGVVQPLCQKVENQKQFLDSIKNILLGANPNQTDPLYSEISYINQQLAPLVLGQMATTLRTKYLADIIDHPEETITVPLSAKRIYYFCLNLLFSVTKRLLYKLESTKNVRFIENNNDITVAPAAVITIPYSAFISTDNAPLVTRQNQENFNDEQQILLETLNDSCDFQLLNDFSESQFALFSGKITSLFANQDNPVLNEFVACLAAKGATQHDIAYFKDKINTEAIRVWTSHKIKFQVFYENETTDYHVVEWDVVTEKDLSLLVFNLSDEKRNSLFYYLINNYKLLYMSTLRQAGIILKIASQSGRQYYTSIFKQLFSPEHFTLINLAIEINSLDDLLLALNNLNQEQRRDLIYICSHNMVTSQLIKSLPFLSPEKQLEIILFLQHRIESLSRLILISAKLEEVQRAELLAQFNFLQFTGFSADELGTIKYLLSCSKYLQLVAFLHTCENGSKELYQDDMLQFIVNLDDYHDLPHMEQIEHLTRSLSSYDQLKTLLPYLPEDAIISTLKKYSTFITKGYQLLEIFEKNIYSGKYNGIIAMEFKDRIALHVEPEPDDPLYISLWIASNSIQKLVIIILQLPNFNERIDLVKTCASLIKDINDLDYLLTRLNSKSHSDPSVEEIDFLNKVVLYFDDKIETGEHLTIIAKHFNIYSISPEYEIPSAITAKLNLISTVDQVLAVINCVPWGYKVKFIIQHINLFSTIDSIDALFQHRFACHDYHNAGELIIQFILNYHPIFKIDTTHYSTILCSILNRVGSTTNGLNSTRVIGCFLAIHDIEFLKGLSDTNQFDQQIAVIVKEIITNVEIAEEKLQARAFPNKLHQSAQDAMNLRYFRTVVDDFLEKPPELPRLMLCIYYLNTRAPRASAIEKYVTLCNAHDQLVHYFSDVEIKQSLTSRSNGSTSFR